MRHLIPLLLISGSLYCQKGFVTLLNDSTHEGYIRFFRDVNGKDGFEIWQTKNDKNPKRFLKETLKKYFDGNDTVSVVHQYQPFSDDEVFFEYADLHKILSGKLNLYKIKNYREYRMITPHMGPGIIPIIIPKKLGQASYIYVLENIRLNLFKALPQKKDDLHQALLEFFFESFIQKYEKNFKEIKYSNVDEFISFVNSKN